jgi:hypothetical protein
MKKGTAVLITILGIFIVLSGGEIYFGNSGIHIDLQDTRFVFSYWSFIIPVLMVLFFVFGLIAAAITKFRGRLFNWLLLISTAGLLLYCLDAWQGSMNVLTELNRRDKPQKGKIKKHARSLNDQNEISGNKPISPG